MESFWRISDYEVFVKYDIQVPGRFHWSGRKHMWVLIFALCSSGVEMSTLTPENAQASSCRLYTITRDNTKAYAGNAGNSIEMPNAINALTCAVQGPAIVAGYLKQTEGAEGKEVLLQHYPQWRWWCRERKEHMGAT
jgi:hypothetical protein